MRPQPAISVFPLSLSFSLRKMTLIPYKDGDLDQACIHRSAPHRFAGQRTICSLVVFRADPVFVGVRFV